MSCSMRGSTRGTMMPGLPSESISTTVLYPPIVTTASAALIQLNMSGVASMILRISPGCSNARRIWR